MRRARSSNDPAGGGQAVAGYGQAGHGRSRRYHMGVRFHQELIRQFRVDDWPYSKLHIKDLESLETKRILFDSRQAAVFDGLFNIPDRMQEHLHFPFPQFYLEFTEPVLLASQEPGHRDESRAMLVAPLHAEISYMGKKKYLAEGSNVTMYLTDADGSVVSRTYLYNLQQNRAFTRVLNCRGGPDPSDIPTEFSNDGWIMASGSIAGIPERHIGWWETIITSYSTLLSWMTAYMMAKSIVVVPEPVSRQVRRAAERAGHIPEPWHVVKVDPRIVKGRAAGEEPKWTHSYRYDVIGHLRFGRHKTREGYRECIEWVPPHQRGLSNDLYIPKTYLVEKD